MVKAKKQFNRVAVILLAFILVASSVSPAFASRRISISSLNVHLNKSTFSYNGKVKKPSVIVQRGKILLKKGKDYTLSYSKGRRVVGRYKVVVRGKGKYKGTKTLFFKIGAGKVKLTEQIKKGKLYPLIKDAKSVYFLGDSITEGTKNNHHPWYEPMKHLIKGNVYNYSKGGYIVQNLINDKDKINKRTAEVYVIAIGTNDVRKGTTKSSAKNGDQYVKKIGKLISNIQEKNSEAKFVLIPPFISRKNDPVSTRSYKDKLKMNSEFAEALKKYCDDNSYTYINPNKYIKERCQKYGYDDYLLDYIHPGPNRGILTYSRAALLYK